MDLTTQELRNCSIAATLSLIGEKWTILILRDVFHGIRRFDEFLARLQCSPAVLSARLKTLTEAGILRKVSYREPGERERFEYRPTRAAVELLPVIIGLMQWGDHHMAASGKGPVELLTRSAGRRVRAALVDDEDQLVQPNDIEMSSVSRLLEAAAEAESREATAAQA
ncbi:transcriptional regulator [Cupriavidus basilensis OR16]|uniref:Transcriptional regulator n=1 Tax=Cupriavidus basilensis OR16 TaxID=1127483 RepID=H1RYB1_9BURK|nr:helix-turn-helix domain-containing protein [Cupriavidus basilensis]EHP44602.1 transcriptional regulator [Cupriavidus basilensis OR16]